MITKMYAIYDRKAAMYYPPFSAVSHGSAVRSFSDLANDRNTNVGRHPLDYVLYCVGGFDDQSGLLMPMPAVEHVSDAGSLVQTQDFLPMDNPGPVARANGEDK